MENDEDLYLVEYGWKGKLKNYHIENIKTRLKKNVSQIMNNGKPNNPNWTPIGLMSFDEAVDYIERFDKELKKRKLEQI